MTIPERISTTFDGSRVKVSLALVASSLSNLSKNLTTSEERLTTNLSERMHECTQQAFTNDQAVTLSTRLSDEMKTSYETISTALDALRSTSNESHERNQTFIQSRFDAFSNEVRSDVNVKRVERSIILRMQEMNRVIEAKLNESEGRLKAYIDQKTKEGQDDINKMSTVLCDRLGTIGVEIQSKMESVASVNTTLHNQITVLPQSVATMYELVQSQTRDQILFRQQYLECRQQEPATIDTPHTSSDAHRHIQTEAAGYAPRPSSTRTPITNLISKPILLPPGPLHTSSTLGEPIKDVVMFQPAIIEQTNPSDADVRGELNITAPPPILPPSSSPPSHALTPPMSSQLHQIEWQDVIAQSGDQRMESDDEEEESDGGEGSIPYATISRTFSSAPELSRDVIADKESRSRRERRGEGGVDSGTKRRRIDQSSSPSDFISQSQIRRQVTHSFEGMEAIKDNVASDRGGNKVKKSARKRCIEQEDPPSVG